MFGRFKLAVLDVILNFKQWRTLMELKDSDLIEMERIIFFCWITND